MVWFFCNRCGDSIKKKSLRNHFNQCSGLEFTCVDCSRSFDRESAQTHNQCVTEHEKYVQGATKPGGFAEQGCFKDGTKAGSAGKQAGPVGTQFLSTSPPWKCSVCNVTCTSEDNLAAHASGAKHRRKARAALGLNKPKQEQQQAAAGEQAANGAGSKQPRDEGAEADAEQPAAKKAKKSKKIKQEQEQQDGAAANGAAEAAAAASGGADSDDDSDAAAEKAEKRAQRKKRNKKPTAAEIAAAAAALTPDQIPGFERAMVTGKRRLAKRGSLKVKQLGRLLAASARTKAAGKKDVDDVQKEAFKQAVLALPQVELKGTKVVWVAGEDE